MQCKTLVMQIKPVGIQVQSVEIQDRWVLAWTDNRKLTYLCKDRLFVDMIIYMVQY